MNQTVFFSWQSDRPSKEGRNLIEKALEMAIERIAKDLKVEEAVREGISLDKDTKNVPGSPPIFETILRKIDNALVFVADLTMCGTRCSGEPTPNPNVLIEYGWALKSLGPSQVLMVMNKAYGDPKDSMPFDLAHVRFPFTYNLPNDASSITRKEEQEKLAKFFEAAIKQIFESEQFKAKLPKEPDPPPFPRKQPMDGKARFRVAGKPLGFIRDALAQVTGSPKMTPIHLIDGPAMWMRLAPLHSPGKTWLIQDLRKQSSMLAALPFVRTTGSAYSLEDEDGCGIYEIWNENNTLSVSYVFSTGEVWLIYAGLAHVPGFVQLDEASIAYSMSGCVSFLDRLGCKKPYWWSVGMEGVQGRQLVIQVPDRSSRIGGVCLSNLIEQEGIYNKDDKPTELLLPFFEKVFDKFGARRSP